MLASRKGTFRLKPSISIPYKDCLAITFLAALAIVARAATGPRTIDDAYITFRYARNLADGIGFVYNNGERVLGTTTPLWTIILGFLYWLGIRDLPSAALAVSALADAGTSALVYWVAVRLGMSRPWALWAAGVYAFTPLSIGFAAGGMESSLFTLLVLSACVASAVGHMASAAFLSALATFARPEGVLLPLLIVGQFLVRRALPPWRVVAAYVMPLLPWSLFALLYFGSVVPNSLFAKSIVYRISALSPHEGALAIVVDPWFPMWIAMLLIIPLLPKGLALLFRTPSRIPLICFAPLLCVSYLLSSIRSVRIVGWYLVPLTPFAILGMAVALSQVRRVWARPLALLFAIGFLLWAVLHNSVRPNLAREEAYQAAAAFLSSRVTLDTIIALPEIGAFGYASKARILDTVGLVSPKALRFYPLPSGSYRGNYAVSPELIESERPHFLVRLDTHIQENLTKAGWFKRDYVLIWSAQVNIWNSTTLRIFERRTS
jgi:hypothetical protein